VESRNACSSNPLRSAKQTQRSILTDTNSPLQFRALNLHGDKCANWGQPKNNSLSDETEMLARESLRTDISESGKYPVKIEESISYMTLCYNNIQWDSATCFESFYHAEYYNSLFASKICFFLDFFCSFFSYYFISLYFIKIFLFCSYVWISTLMLLMLFNSLSFARSFFFTL